MDVFVHGAQCVSTGELYRTTIPVLTHWALFRRFKNDQFLPVYGILRLFCFLVNEVKMRFLTMLRYGGALELKRLVPKNKLVAGLTGLPRLFCLENMVENRECSMKIAVFIALQPFFTILTF